MSENAKQTLKAWFFGLLAAVISGGANAAAAIVGAQVISPQTFNMGSEYNIGLVWQLAWLTFVTGAITGAIMYLKQSPIPGKYLSLLAVALTIGALATMAVGCVSITARHPSGIGATVFYAPEKGGLAK